MAKTTSYGFEKKKQATPFNMKKFEEAVHYICSNVTEQDQLGAVKLNKILYFSDMGSYAETGRSITGATYVKQFRGPVPTQVVPAIKFLEEEGRLKVSHVSLVSSKRRQYETAGTTDTKMFEAGELERINDMIRFVCEYTAPEISEISHHDVWQAADIGEVLPYETFLVSYAGDIGEKEIALAQAAVSAAAKDGRKYG